MSVSKTWKLLLEGKISIREEYITNQELTQAWENWLHFHRGIHCEETEERFFAYCRSLEQNWIDAPLDWSNGEETYHVARSTAQRIKKLLSPNYNTWLEAYYINHPWK